MKIVYVTVRFPGPSETFACLDVRTLVRCGDEVHVLPMRGRLDGHERLMREQELDDARVSAMGPAARLRGLAAALKRPALSVKLAAFIAATTWRRPAHLAAACALFPAAMECHRRISEIGPDVVHLFWGHFPSLVGFLVARTHPETVLSHFLGAYDLEYGFGPTAPVARSADVVWTHAAVNLPRIEALGVAPERIRVVPRGIDTASAAAPAAGRPARVAAAGRLTPVKRFDDAIRVFARVRGRVPGAVMTVAGDGPERDRLERLAAELGVADGVEFTGRIPQRELFSVFERSAVFLLMSQSPSERLPNAAKEAALRGCVAVTTDSPGIDELFTDGADAFVVPAGDVAAAAERVVTLLTDASARERMARAAHERMKKAFDVRAAMGTYRDHWLELASRSPTGGV